MQKIIKCEKGKNKREINGTGIGVAGIGASVAVKKVKRRGICIY